MRCKGFAQRLAKSGADEAFQLAGRLMALQSVDDPDGDLGIGQPVPAQRGGQRDASASTSGRPTARTSAPRSVWCTWYSETRGSVPSTWRNTLAGIVAVP